MAVVTKEMMFQTVTKIREQTIQAIEQIEKGKNSTFEEQKAILKFFGYPEIDKQQILIEFDRIKANLEKELKEINKKRAELGEQLYGSKKIH